MFNIPFYASTKRLFAVLLVFTFLGSLQQAANADEAICHVAKVSFNKTELLAATPRWDLDKGLPDIFVLAIQNEKVIALCGLPEYDKATVEWDAKFAFPFDPKRPVRFELRDADWLQSLTKILGNKINEAFQKAKKKGKDYINSRETVEGWKKIIPGDSSKRRGRKISQLNLLGSGVTTRVYSLPDFSGKISLRVAPTYEALKSVRLATSGAKVKILSASVSKKNKKGKHWDPLKGKPDLFAVLFISTSKGLREIGRTKSVKNSFSAKWNKAFSGLKLNSDFKVVVYDKDAKHHDKVGTYKFRIDGNGKLVRGSKSKSLKKFYVSQ